MAAFYARRTYRLKEGIEVRGSFRIMSSVASEDRYVHEVVLENTKDRAVVIFTILLELNHGYYVELEQLEDEPLILGPFEAIRRPYEPIDMYSAGMKRVRLDPLLKNQKVRKRLVLATSQGRYNVTEHIERWNPVRDFFRNYTTVIVQPLRSTYEGTAYGSGTKYIVRLIHENRDPEIIPIYPHDYRLKKFRGFQLTADSLKSKESLERYLIEQALEGNLNCTNLEVFDLEDWREQTYNSVGEEEFTAEKRAWATYALLGRIQTKFENARLKRQNRKRRKKQLEAQKSTEI